MEYNSEEDSDISESEINDYKDKPYEQLKAGMHKVKYSDVAFRCPFCKGRKKQDYRYKDLLQHASGVGKGSSNRSAKQKANHLALAKYLEIDLADAPGPSQPVTELKPSEHPEHGDLYIWPWTGIVVNILAKQNEEGRASGSANWLAKELSKYRPLSVQTSWSQQDHTMFAIVDFGKEWTGFRDAMEFEKDFETDHHGKKEWSEQRMHHGSNIYGWFARVDDYNSEGPIGDYLRNQGELKTISSIVQEKTQQENSMVASLTNVLDVTNENIDELQSKCNEKSMSLSRLVEEKERLHQEYNEERRKLYRIARNHTRRIIEESDKLRDSLDYRRKNLEQRQKELAKLEALNERERKGLDEEMQKNAVKNNLLQMASMEQKKADENVLRLMEEQKREKEAAMNKLLQLEKQLDAKQKLELEIAELKGKLQVMKHMEGEDDIGIQKKLKEMADELEEKMEEMVNMEDLNQTLIAKERASNDELQEARQELISISWLVGLTLELKEWESLMRNHFKLHSRKGFLVIKQKWSLQNSALCGKSISGNHPGIHLKLLRVKVRPRYVCKISFSFCSDTVTAMAANWVS
ncbi:PREDICTED: factor of DNA methylation 1-like isoform X2 [Nelumbo nucifera]|uniref:Factor of DNA methylation 1-like isoform X2 n=1 Tax=Nelumbo nucifera TaxID=4432 RepID=A0A1U8ADQ4_NELNU|nr:PREDICTED: factor of DNA methylation 1-like isoform X2 [Nelumbo nucifera]